MLPPVHAGCLLGIEAKPLLVEARIAPGLPGFELIGLSTRRAREARIRVKSALGASGYELPKRNLVINVAPGEERKGESALDLAIAIAILTTTETVDPKALPSVVLLGELSLSGELRGIRGVLPQLRSAQRRGLTRACVPTANAPEAALVPGLALGVAAQLREVVDWLNGEATLPAPTPAPLGEAEATESDLADVRGQEGARRALEIAAAGSHHMLMLGPPGAGKTMLARRLPGALPRPTRDEALAIATIGSAAGMPSPAGLDAVRRPFRAPHHTASAAAMVGGGEPVRPGEVTLAHGGVLFLDELPEFRRDVIETLRTTMSTGSVHIARARQHVVMPAAPLIVAAMNPCPCGFAGDAERLCSCSPFAIERYRGRLSGPLLDRFDLHVVVPRVPARTLRSRTRGEPTSRVAERVTAARARARARPKLRFEDLAEQCEESAHALLESAVDRLGLSARAYVKALRIARTIADLAGRERIDEEHVAEAVQYRVLDRRPGPRRKAG